MRKNSLTYQSGYQKGREAREKEILDIIKFKVDKDKYREILEQLKETKANTDYESPEL